MADMISAARFFRQVKVAFDLPPFAFGRNPAVSVCPRVYAVMNIPAEKERIVLTMGGDDFPERLRLFHRRFHHIPALDAASVVGKGDHRTRKLLHIGKRFSKLSFCNRPVRIYGNPGAACNRIRLNLQILHRIRRGREIRHRTNRRIAAMRRRRRTACDILFIRKARLSEMHMHIAKAG